MEGSCHDKRASRASRGVDELTHWGHTAAGSLQFCLLKNMFDCFGELSKWLILAEFRWTQCWRCRFLNLQSDCTKTHFCLHGGPCNCCSNHHTISTWRFMGIELKAVPKLCPCVTTLVPWWSNTSKSTTYVRWHPRWPSPQTTTPWAIASCFSFAWAGRRCLLLETVLVCL